ncbi:MAG: Ig-like domain-containing protein, partial [Clostridium sp.]|nr:Ig-like domain-containing protein [Clostridium sp.]
MKARINYKSKKTIIIIAIAVVLLIAAITGTVAYIKGNNNAAAAMGNSEITEPANNGNDSNNNGGVENPNTPNTDNPEQIPIIDDNQNPTTPAQNGDTTTNPGTTTNQGTTTGTTTGNAGTTVPDTEYTQTTVVENPWKTEDITWMPISLQAKTETTGLNINTPNLEVSKTAYVGNQEISAEPVNTVAQPGQEITYVIRIKNTGNLATSTIRTVDAIPEGTEIVEISEGGVLANGKITWKNIIKAGETVELTFKVKVISETEITLISNTAKVNGEDTPTTETPVVTTAKEAYLIVDGELAEATSAKVGDTLRYVITITNNSNVPGKTTVTDTIPDGTEIVDRTISEGGKLEGRIITWNDVNVKANGETTVSFDVIINKETAAGEVVKEVTNAAVVGEKETPPVITPVANITGKKEANKTEAKVGDTLIYTITLTNSGNAAGTVTVTDEIPEGTSLVAGSITGDGVESNGTITWNVVVPAKDEVSVSFKVTIDATTSTGEAVKEVTNTAVVDGENTPQVTTLVANITGKKEVNTPEAKVGDTLTYTITLTNSGNAAGTVTVTDEIPAGTRIKDPTIDGYDATTNTMTWSNVTVPANGKAITLTLEVIVEGGVSEITNVAQIDNNEIPDRPETVVKYHYTIEHYIQGLDENFELKDTETSGEVLAGTETSYTANDYTGFTFDDDKTENKGAKVPTNNNLVIKLYYTRNSYKVTYKYEGTTPN